MQLTLSNRLRLAALTRAEHGGRVVGTYVIDKDGVIDLRALEDRGPANRASDPASLLEIAGLFGDAADVSALYDDPTERGRRRFRRRTPRGPTDEDAAAESSLDEPDTEVVAGEHGIDETADEEIIDLTEAEDAETAGAPIPAGDPVAAGDRIDPEPDPPARPPPAADEPETVIELRDDRGPSNMQAAITDFNTQPPLFDPAEPDIDSGILFGHGGVVPETVDRGELFDIDLTPDPPRGVLFGGGDQRTDVTTQSVEPAEAPPARTDEPPTETPVDNESEAEKTCPMCGSDATKDFANQFLEIDFYSCGSCFHMWHLGVEHTDD